MNRPIEMRPKPNYKLTKGLVGFETFRIDGHKHFTLLVKCDKEDCQ